MISKRVLTFLSQRILAISFSLWSSCLIPQSARGQNLYWDIPTVPPSGTWNAANPFWPTTSAGRPPLSPWADGSNAVFAATGLEATGPYTVTLAAVVTVGDLT